ncbi:MAG TPA: hypothetical protein VFT50_07800 [Baekduia sp.]|nr:hypothetical protein [Baekduia sp.]
MSAVRPEFGPTLPELLRPRLARLSRPARVVLVVLAVLVVAAVGSRVVGGGGDVRTVAVSEPIGFRFEYAPPLHRRHPQAGELARVGGHGQSFAVRPLRLPPYRGDAAGFLPLYATHLSREMAARLPGFRVHQEGRANINRIQGYELRFSYDGPDGHPMLGRRELLLPTATAREGVDLLLVARRAKHRKGPGRVGASGPMKRALRSFELEGADQS